MNLNKLKLNMNDNYLFDLRDIFTKERNRSASFNILRLRNNSMQFLNRSWAGDFTLSIEWH